MTKIKTKVNINWQTFKGRVLIYCVVSTTVVCYDLYLKRALSVGNRTNINVLSIL